MIADRFTSRRSRPGPRSFGGIRTDARQVRLAENTCVGCGCRDLAACVDAIVHQPCFWARLDRRALRGVCSACPGALERWDAGGRELRRDRS